jgi:cardiolipin synthase
MTRADDNNQFPGQAFEVSGHRLNLLHAPEDRLAGLIGLINTAKQSIRMFSYMFANDRTGQEVLQALVSAAGRGVTVQLIIDSFGSADTSSTFFEPLVASGGAFQIFGSRWGLGYLVRNHQKILIVDDAYVLVGGFNITDDYFGRGGDNSWEDLGVILSGPEITAIIEYFDRLDSISDHGRVRFKEVRQLIRSWRPSPGPIRWLLGGPSTRMSPWGLALKKALERARKLDIVAAYFSPTQSFMRRLARVAKRRNGARLILAGKTDNRATMAASRLLYRYLLKRNAKIYEFQTRPLHMKLLVIDSAVYIGSANMDVRSLFINMEIMLRIEDVPLANHMRRLIDTMAAQSEEQTRKGLRVRDNWWNRIHSALAYFLVNTVDYSIGRRIKLDLLKRD